MGTRKATVLQAEMEFDLQEEVLEVVVDAMEKCGTVNEIPAFVKRMFDQRYQNSWHCIVGKNFSRQMKAAADIREWVCRQVKYASRDRDRCTTNGIRICEERRENNHEPKPTIQVETTAEKALIRDLLNRYKRYGVIGRPVNDSRIQMRVQYGLQMIQILGLDENKQLLRTNCWTVYRWNDALLRWNSSLYEGIEVIRILPKQIWTPDIKLYNFADERLQEYREAGLLVYSDGSILWLQQALFKSTCQVEITYFPFDSQVCMLEFGSLTYHNELLELDWWTPDDSKTPMPYVDFSDYVPANEWYADGEAERHLKHEDRLKQLQSVKRYRVRYIKVDGQKQERHYTVLRFLVRLYRNPSFHLFILVVPCLLLSLLTLVVFWLPPDSSAKMMLGINIFVAFFVLLLLLAESMPSAVKNFPLIGIFFCLNMAMVTLSTFLATMVVNLFYGGNDGQPPPRWVRKFIIDKCGYALGMRQNIPIEARKPSTGLEAARSVVPDFCWGALVTENLVARISKRDQDVSMENLLLLDCSEDESLQTDQSKALHEAKDIKQALSTLDHRLISTHAKERVLMEWRTLALIVDRVFFIFYLILMAGILFLVVWTTDVVDMTQILTDRNVLVPKE